MAATDSFVDLMDRLRRGDDDFLRELFGRYSDRLKALARVRLGSRLQGQGEQSDVLQSMWMSFVRRQRAGEFDQVVAWDDLWSLLACMTVRKCIDRIRYFSAACRREPDGTAAPVDRTATEPTPDEQAVYDEAFESFLAALDPRDRQIITLHLQGLDDEQISAESPDHHAASARSRR